MYTNILLQFLDTTIMLDNECYTHPVNRPGKINDNKKMCFSFLKKIIQIFVNLFIGARVKNIVLFRLHNIYQC
jgi:hypothetical protein